MSTIKASNLGQGTSRAGQPPVVEVSGEQASLGSMSSIHGDPEGLNLNDEDALANVFTLRPTTDPPPVVTSSRDVLLYVIKDVLAYGTKPETLAKIIEWFDHRGVDSMTDLVNLYNVDPNIIMNPIYYINKDKFSLQLSQCASFRNICQ